MAGNDASGRSSVSAKTLGALVRRADHDLRSPLNTIVGWAHLLERDSADPARVRHAAELIARNARAMATMLEELSDLTRLALGDRVLVTTPVSLAQTVSELVQAERRHAEQCRVELVYAEPVFDCTVLIDRGRLRTPLGRLLEQLVVATTPESRVRISIDTVQAHGRVLLHSERPREGQHLLDLPHAAAVSLLLACQPGAALREDAGHTLIVELPLQHEAAPADQRTHRSH